MRPQNQQIPPISYRLRGPRHLRHHQGRHRRLYAYPDIVDLVPEDIGIILYLSAGSYIGLRKKKECTFKPLDEEQQKWFILSTLKRLEDTAWGAALTRGDCRTCEARDTCQKTVATKEPPGGVQIITGCSAYRTHPEERLW